MRYSNVVTRFFSPSPKSHHITPSLSKQLITLQIGIDGQTHFVFLNPLMDLLLRILKQKQQQQQGKICNIDVDNVPNNGQVICSLLTCGNDDDNVNGILAFIQNRVLAVSKYHDGVSDHVGLSRVWCSSSWASSCNGLGCFGSGGDLPAAALLWYSQGCGVAMHSRAIGCRHCLKVESCKGNTVYSSGQWLMPWRFKGCLEPNHLELGTEECSEPWMQSHLESSLVKDKILALSTYGEEEEF